MIIATIIFIISLAVTIAVPAYCVKTGRIIGDDAPSWCLNVAFVAMVASGLTILSYLA